MRGQDPDLTDPMGQRMPVNDDARFHPGTDLGAEPGFRQEPEFPPQHTYQSTAYVSAETTTAAPPAALDDVFDDPADGEPGRDRLMVHWVWELVLLVGVVTLAALVWQAQSDALRGQELSQLLVLATGYTLLAAAAGLTMRAGAVNLAIGPVAVAAGIRFAEHGAEGVVATTLGSLMLATLLGAVLAVLVVGLHVPGWAASLAAAAGAVVWVFQQPPEVPLSSTFDPTDQAPLLFVLVAAVVIVGGLLGTVKPVRRVLGRFRPVGDPARRRGVVAALTSAAAITVSMPMAALAGVVLASGAGAPVQGSGGIGWLELTVIGVALALVGGTSAFGRRGGVFGTVLAVLAFVLFDLYQQLQGWGIAVLASAAVALVVGLAVTRAVEVFGRPGSADPDDWSEPAPPDQSPYPEAHPPSAASWVSGADSWGSSLPAKPVGEHPPAWDERWGR